MATFNEYQSRESGADISYKMGQKALHAVHTGQTGVDDQKNPVSTLKPPQTPKRPPPSPGTANLCQIIVCGYHRPATILPVVLIGPAWWS